MGCFYAIGDIHGYLNKLEGAHALIDADRAENAGFADAPVVHVGDYADRGPDVAGVLEYLMAGQDKGAPWITLRGNHDRMMWLFLQDPALDDPVRPDLHWLEDRIGGRKTLASYGVNAGHDRTVAAIHADARAKVPQAHLDFIMSCPLWHDGGDVFFCHAGVRPGVDLHQQDENDLVWIRDGFLKDQTDHGPLIVHGHTAIDDVTHYGNRLNIDTRAGYDGPLSVVAIDGRQVWQVTAMGRVPITPTPAQ